MATEQDLMAGARRAAEAGDDDLAREFVARVKKLRAAPAENTATNLRTGRSSILTGLSEAGNAVGLGIPRRAGAAIGAGISQFTDHPMGYNEAFANAKAADEAAAAEHPIAATTGAIGGSVLGGAALLRTAPSLALKGGQALLNTGKIAATGGLTSELSAFGDTGDINDAVAAGAIGPAAGLAGAVGGKVLGKMASFVANRTGTRTGAQRSQAAVQVIANQLKMKPDEITAALDAKSVELGRPAGYSDILDARQRGALKQFAAKNPAFGANVAEAEEKAATALPRAQSGNKSQAQDVSSLATERDARMTAALDAPVQPHTAQASRSALTLADEHAKDVQDAFNTAAQNVAEGKPVNAIAAVAKRAEFGRRKAAKGAALPTASDTEPGTFSKPYTGPLRNAPVAERYEVEALLAEPKVAAALKGDTDLQGAVDDVLSGKQGALTLDDFENLRQQLNKARDSVMVGNSIRGQKINLVSKRIEEFARMKYPEYGKALDRYRADWNYEDAFKHGRAGKSRTNVDDPRLRKALGSAEGLEGYRLGTAERRAAENVSAIAPSFIKPETTASGTLAHAAQGVVSAKMGSPWAVHHWARALIPNLKTDDKTLRVAAEYLTNPDMARQGVSILKQAGATQKQIEQVLAAAAGQQGGKKRK